jgi:hypothetical protein
MATDVLAGTGCTMHAFSDEWGIPVAQVSLTACGEPAIAVITFACVHEHIDLAKACAGCAADVQRAADLLICSHCADGPEPHDCAVAMKIRWLLGKGERGCQDVA